MASHFSGGILIKIYIFQVIQMFEQEQKRVPPTSDDTLLPTIHSKHFCNSSEQHQNEKTDCADLSAKGCIFILGWAQRPSSHRYMTR
ncbi:MAG: hypothetical protein LUD12_08210 [Lachnospiraceae bacterium]|nr:hypothetical protein [Lachnospiraceae bacterium]